MSERKAYDVALQILDHQLVDVHGRHCGRIDDLEIVGGPGEEAAITAIVVGAPAWPERTHGVLARLLRRVASGASVRIPWADVIDVGPTVRLGGEARDFGLNRGEERASKPLSRLPGS